MTCIVGAGAHTPIGWTLAESAAAVRAGVGRILAHPDFVDEAGEPLSVSMTTWVSAELTGADRLVRIGRRAAHAALVQALRGSGIRLAGLPLRVFLALPETRPGVTGETHAAVGARFQAILARWGATAEITVLPGGHAAGIIALQRAHDSILHGRAELCLAGGIDSYIDGDTLAWLEEAKQLRTGNSRHGFIPGEAAGFCLLASGALAARHGLRALCAVIGAGAAEEHNAIKTRTVCTGDGLTAAFAGALSGLPEGDRADRLICDLNGEPYRTDELGFTLARTGPHFVHPGAFVAPADCWGDVGAASGPLFAGLVAAAVLRGYARDRFTLLSAGSEAGLRAAVLLRAEPSPPRQR